LFVNYQSTKQELLYAMRQSRGFYRSRRSKRKRFLHPVQFFFTGPARQFNKNQAAADRC
jgi:hypothetical protein